MTAEWSRKAARIAQELNRDRTLPRQKRMALLKLLQASKAEADLPEAFKKYIKQAFPPPRQPSQASPETIAEIKAIINQFSPETVRNTLVTAGLRPGPKTPELPEEQVDGQAFRKKRRNAEAAFFEKLKENGLEFREAANELTAEENAILVYLIFTRI